MRSLFRTLRGCRREPAGIPARGLPKYMERLAYATTAWRLGRYYRTYPAYVEDEVKAALRDPASQFQRGRSR